MGHGGEMPWECVAMRSSPEPGRRGFVLLGSVLALLAACNGGPAETPDAPDKPAKVEHGDLSPDQLAAADTTALVPSPAEMQRALDRAGLSEALATRVGEPRTVDLADADADRVAIRTGVVLSELVLTAKTASPEQVAVRVGQVRTGLATLGAKEDVLGNLDELSNRVRNGAVAGDELVRELDELSGSLLPRIEGELPERATPLVRAGSWVNGAWLVSGALIDQGRFEYATALLRHPVVVDYFKRYVKTEGEAIAASGVTRQLQDALRVLDEACDKPALEEPDVRAIHEATGQVLRLL